MLSRLMMAPRMISQTCSSFTGRLTNSSGMRVSVAAAYALGRLRPPGFRWWRRVIFATYVIPQTILFVPDRHLGQYLQEVTGRKMILWNGACMVHEIFSVRDLLAMRRKLPGAHTIAHPECPANVREHYDRAVQGRGADALTPARDKACGACSTELTAQTVNDLIVGAFVVCKTCGRILYPPA